MRIIARWGPAIAWMVLIFLFSSRSRVEVSDQDSLNFIFFKTLHVVEYFILYVLVLRATRDTRRTRAAADAAYVCAFILTVLYGASDEFHQTMTPTRQGTVRDVIIDAIGAVLAWISLQTLVPKMPRRLQKLVKNLGV